MDIWSSRNVNLGTGFTPKFNYAVRDGTKQQGGGPEEDAQLTENDIQLIYFQFSEIMSAIKMLVGGKGSRGLQSGWLDGRIRDRKGCSRVVRH